MIGFTDIHHHLLYGLDDGPSTVDEMERMLVSAFRDDIRRIMVTPHVSPGIIPFDEEAFYYRLEEAKAFCNREKLGLELLPGAEVLYTPMATSLLRQKRIPALNNTEYVLIEFLPDVQYEALEKGVASLLHSGFFPVLAHVERYHCLLRRPKLAAKLKARYDVLYQVNCATVVEEKGIWIKRFCRQMFGEGLIDVVATDAHDTVLRICRMKEAYRLLALRYGANYAARLAGIS